MADPGEAGLDELEPHELVERVLTAQDHVAAAVHARTASIAAAVERLTSAYLRGGRIVLLGAGTSGRLAALEAAELPGTFGLDPSRVSARVAGATPEQPYGSDEAEDDEAAGRNAITELLLSAADSLIAVSASGSTPYTVAAARAARRVGATVIAVTNAESTPLGEAADVAIEVVVGPEIVLGSTRLAAGTAQKLVLNTLTTATMVRCGRVYGRFMIDVVPANAKLVHRATELIAQSTGISLEQARDALARCGNRPRVAIIHLLTGLPPDTATALSTRHSSVRDAIESARRPDRQ